MRKKSNKNSFSFFRKLKNDAGFTLIEVLLAVAVIAGIAGISVPALVSLQVNNDLNVATNNLVQSLRRAQLLSQAVSGDEMWGVYVQSGSITIFQGNSYAIRNSEFDEVFSTADSIIVSGISEIVFEKSTGFPSQQGDIVLTPVSGASKAININEKGVIEY